MTAAPPSASPTSLLPGGAGAEAGRIGPAPADGLGSAGVGGAAAVPLVGAPPTVATTAGRRARAGRYAAAVLELSKPRITRMVVLTAIVGFLLSLHGVVSGSGGAESGWWAWTASVGGVSRFALTAAGCIAGVALASSGANALNMWWESPRDARMRRTAARPLPAGRVGPASAAAWGWGLAAAGVAVLWLCCGPVPAMLAAATVLVYVLLYTPLKPASIFNTLVGAVPGALPPLIGWTAAAGLAASAAPGAQAAVGAAELSWWSGLDQPGGWSLFALMFVWQVPHVCALAWMHREDYARGGFRMLPIIDPAGHATAWTVLSFSVLLVPVSLLPWLAIPGSLGWAYAAVAAVTGALAVALAVGVVRRPTTERARGAFIGSIIHLPLLLVAMVGEVVTRWVF